MNTEKMLAQLVDRLLSAYGRDVRAVILYGSAVTGDFHQKHSDVNVLCVIRALDVDKIEKSEPIAHWWRGLGNPAPLLLSEEELADGADSFAIEFLDIQEQHKLLHGEDLVSQLSVDPQYHRVQTEHELRTKLLALRHRYLSVHRDGKAVVRLMQEAMPNFAALFRHALLLAGERPGLKKQEIFEKAGARFGFDPAPFTAALEVRRGDRRAGDVEPRTSFAGYYEAVVRVTQAVDKM